MPKYDQTVFISYAWGSDREDVVNQIDEALQKRGIEIIRDKRSLGYRGSIKDFMERIGRGHCVIVVISDKYLRSPNCMFELVEIAENKQFHDRIFPIVLSDANIYDPLGRIEYVKFWEAKRAELAEAMRSVDPANLHGIRDDIDQYDRIRDRISGITSILKDMNTLTPEMHRDNDFSDLYDAITRRMEEGAPGTTDLSRQGEDADRIAAQKAEAERSEKQNTAENRLGQFDVNNVITASNLLSQGKKLTEAKDWQAAIQVFQQVLGLIPDHAETKKLLLAAEAELAKIPGDRNAPEAKTSQQVSKTGKPLGTKVSGKTIAIGLASLLGLIVIVSIIILTSNKVAPVTSAGMVQVPAGSYTIGVDTPIELDEFWVDRYEVTNNDYKKFVAATKTQPPEYWTNSEIPAGQREHPVMQVTWEQAKDYCEWVGKRLPTEAEWEVTARGPFGWMYPWGNNPNKVKQKTDGTLAVDGNPANRSYFGAYFMSGNVWEWVSEPYSPTATNEQVMRGGAYGPLDVLTIALAVAEDSASNKKTGMRCAASGKNVIQEYDDALAISDDFETSNTNWPGINMDSFLFDYHEVGYYHVEARDANKFVPAFYEHDTFSNFILETQVFVDKLNTDNQQGNFLYGLGIQVSDEKFYAFVISAKDRKWQILEGPYNQESYIGNISDLTILAEGNDDSIIGALSDKAEDRLTVIANGNKILYYVNGDLVYDYTIEDRQKLGVGFVVETLENVTRVHIHYNWVTLQIIEPFDY